MLPSPELNQRTALKRRVGLAPSRHLRAPHRRRRRSRRPRPDRHAVRHRIGPRATQPASKLESGERAIVHAACVHPCGNAAARASESQHAPPRRRSRLGAAASPRANARGQLAGRASGWPGPAAVGASRVRAGANGRMEAQPFDPSSFFTDTPPPSWSRAAWTNASTRPPARASRPRAQGGLPSRRASAHARALALGASAHAPSVGPRGERAPDPKASAWGRACPLSERLLPKPYPYALPLPLARLA